MVCKVCEGEFTSRIGKPGYINVCEECSEPDVAKVKAEVSWENKHTPIIRVTDAHTANVFNAAGRRKGCGLIGSLMVSGRILKSRHGERRSDQGPRGWQKT